mmetsp:Transcript_22659/g.37996  ORF Transcript_22659/g.37996 Transcript_22659/m.37996 type:complete len:225 (+) Transcript_22659:763-1437(+)
MCFFGICRRHPLRHWPSALLSNLIPLHRMLATLCAAIKPQESIWCLRGCRCMATLIPTALWDTSTMDIVVMMRWMTTKARRGMVKEGQAMRRGMKWKKGARQKGMGWRKMKTGMTRKAVTGMITMARSTALRRKGARRRHRIGPCTGRTSLSRALFWAACSRLYGPLFRLVRVTMAKTGFKNKCCKHWNATALNSWSLWRMMLLMLPWSFLCRMSSSQILRLII